MTKLFNCWWRLLLIFVLTISMTIAIAVGGNPQSPPSLLLERGKNYYQAGEFDKSIELLEQASLTYPYHEDNLQQAQILSLISLAQQKLGNWKIAQENIDKSLNLLANEPGTSQKNRILAQIWTNKGHLELATGQTKAALITWQNAEQLYHQSSDSLGVKGSLINQAQAAENLGFYRRSCDLVLQAFDLDYHCGRLDNKQLTNIFQQLETSSDSWQITGVRSIANSLMLMGNLSQAEAFIRLSETLIKKSEEQSPQVKYKTLLSLGNFHKATALREKERNNLTSFAYSTQEAIKCYQQITNSFLSTKISPLERLQAQLNQLTLLIEIEQWSSAKQLAHKINIDSDRLGLNRQSIYAEVNLARSLTILKQKSIGLDCIWEDIVAIYQRAIDHAEQIGDLRIESYAMGYLGQLEREQQLSLDSTPQQLIEQALNLAQIISAPEIAYRWQWQLGKIYHQQGDTDKAISAYQAAVITLQDLRNDLVSLNREIQFSFREQVEPIYRELADLLLTNSSTDISSKGANLETARDVIESLQIAELDNYFQDACLTFGKKNIDEIDSSAAVIYTIILPDRLEVILSLCDRTFLSHTEIISQTDLENIVQQLRYNLIQPDKLLEVQQLSSQVYNWLIRPFQAELIKQETKTLVFVLDDILKTVPMATLYDGEQYLIEQYALALTPGLRLLNSNKKSEFSQVLAGGVSEPLQVGRRKFTGLKNVTNELNNIQTNLNGKVLLNSEFTETNLAKQLNSKPASILHLASHGQFSSNPDGTFLLLWQKLLTIQDFSRLLTSRKQAVANPIELLVLSACETARGDKRAALGLAGMAIRTGAISTLATLWQVSDDSTTSLMKYFYQKLDKLGNVNKAEALRQAQLELWKNPEKDWQVPAFWSSYVLVGNWS